MKIYLAIPYSFNPPFSHRIVNKIAANLMEQGHIVFSPISHSHHIADHLPNQLRIDSHWWMQHDLPFIEWSDEVHVVNIGEEGGRLVTESKGVMMEIEHAKKHFKPIKIIEYYD